MIIVASVSCIYGLGAPVDYGATVLKLRTGGSTGATRSCATSSTSSTSATTRRSAGRFRVRGDTLELQPASEEFVIRVEFFGDEVERITGSIR